MSRSPINDHSIPEPKGSAARDEHVEYEYRGDITKELFLTWILTGNKQRLHAMLNMTRHEALKANKNGLMEQLFPSPEEVEA
jgi:hypothetical protein